MEEHSAGAGLILHPAIASEIDESDGENTLNPSLKLRTFKAHSFNFETMQINLYCIIHLNIKAFCRFSFEFKRIIDISEPKTRDRFSSPECDGR
jgi:hypothetical protein